METDETDEKSADDTEHVQYHSKIHEPLSMF